MEQPLRWAPHDVEVWSKTHEAMSKEIPTLFEALESDFRDLLGLNPANRGIMLSSGVD